MAKLFFILLTGIFSLVTILIMNKGPDGGHIFIIAPVAVLVSLFIAIFLSFEGQKRAKILVLYIIGLIIFVTILLLYVYFGSKSLGIV